MTFARVPARVECIVVRERSGYMNDYLRLEGPFEYPRWGAAAEATQMSSAKAMLYAECLKPYRDRFTDGTTKMMAVPADVVAVRVSAARSIP